MPARKVLDTYGKVQLDMSMGCPGERDQDCPEWDHVVQMYVCCEGEWGGWRGEWDAWCGGGEGCELVWWAG
jgi:hypothetical protein